MGEARRKKLLQQAELKNLDQIDMSALARSVHKVVTALTPQSGLDCVWYAQIGAAALEALGIKAQAVAGEAAWRVGPGSGDVISHLEEATAPSKLFAPQGKTAAVFHAWIVLPDAGYLLDFTTRMLKRKAQLLDEADGGNTNVEWAPDFLLTPLASCMKPSAVTNGYDSGAYAYIPSEAIAARVMTPRPGSTPEEMAADVQRLAEAALLAYRQQRRGIDMKIIGVGSDENDQQDETNAPSPPVHPYRPT